MFHLLSSDIEKPGKFTFPFDYEPHPLCRMAAAEVQHHLVMHREILADAQRGKMFGVLVCERGDELGFLAAYSGLLAGRNDWSFFVPPVFDAQQPDGHFKQEERLISSMTDESQREIRKQRSQQLQRWLFDQYQLRNARGEVRSLVDIWQDYYQEKVLRKFPLPPGGTGDCCAPKLLQYAYLCGFRPLCMAEFWWGDSPKQEIRHHLCYYPACQGKCKPVLAWMLQGLDVDDDPQWQRIPPTSIETVYEDEDLVVVNKPSGMLSVPGKQEQYAVETIMRQRFPEAHVAHRLDMATSGLLIVAKNMEVYRNLQEQFVRHEVRKRYVAILEPSASTLETSGGGTIRLPMRPDMLNRPCQIVDREHGKQAITDYEFLGPDKVALYPQTGRTHQLRVHCAHPDGLGRPILGDTLYGTSTGREASGRLMLHAEQIWFRHPVTGQDMHLVRPFEDGNG